VNELIRYLLENMYIDFQGDLTVDSVRGFLKDDNSKEAKALLARIVKEKGVDDMLITLADCLKDSLEDGIDEGVVKEQLASYAES